jgi:hypothetical protein
MTPVILYAEGFDIFDNHFGCLLLTNCATAPTPLATAMNGLSTPGNPPVVRMSAFGGSAGPARCCNPFGWLVRDQIHGPGTRLVVFDRGNIPRNASKIEKAVFWLKRWPMPAIVLRVGPSRQPTLIASRPMALEGKEPLFAFI